MKLHFLKAILISLLVILTLGACSAQARDVTAGSTRRVAQTIN